MSEENSFELISRPGLKRDGTNNDSDYCRDALWTRWQRGRPRKIGGYRSISANVIGPVRTVHVDSRSGFSRAHMFSGQAVEQLTFDASGVGSGLVDRTPASFVANTNYSWQADSLFSAAGATPTLIASATPDLAAIDSDIAGPLYSGDISGGAVLTAVADGAGPITVSGGCVVLQPFLFVYGSNGLIRNSNANNIVGTGGWSGTNANIANVAGTKIVKGLPLRGGGNSPAGLFWALDSLLRVSFVGGTALWRYDTVSSQTTVLAKNAIIEYDGVYYWPGVDRFFTYNGVVQELPNEQNLNWFFDNLNKAQRNKVFAVKVPRFGEIWWLFPFGNSVECNQVIIYNVREKTWYDTRLSRSAGFPASVFTYPVLAGGEDSQTTVKLSYTPDIGVFKVGDTVSGDTSLAKGRVVKLQTNAVNLSGVSGTFQVSETIRNSGSSATGTVSAVPLAQQLDMAWQHESGVDKVVGQSISAIEASFETRQFSFTDGGPVGAAPSGLNKQVRLTRLEPDFVLSGNLTVTVHGQAFPQSTELVSDTFTLTPTTRFLDLREQRRFMALRFSSNEVGANFEMGKTLMLVEPGDTRG